MKLHEFINRIVSRIKHHTLSFEELNFQCTREISFAFQGKRFRATWNETDNSFLVEERVEEHPYLLAGTPIANTLTGVLNRS